MSFHSRLQSSPVRPGRDLLLLCIFLSASVSGVANDEFELRKPVLGSVNSLGFLIQGFELGVVPSGQEELPVYLLFHTDNRVPPGVLGPLWSLPLLESALIDESRGSLRWQKPGTAAGFFRVDPGAELTTAERRQGVLVYRASSGTWTARSSAPGQVVITDTVRPGVVFEYQNGRLVRFRAAADQPVWRLDYRGDQLRGMRADGESQLAIELIRQRGIGPVEEIRVGKRRFKVDFGRATIHAPDGLTYARHQMPLLTFVAEVDGPFQVAIDYSSADPVVEVIPGGRDQPDRSQRFHLNKMVVSEAEATRNFVWKAENGFGFSDDFGTYQVSNESIDPTVPFPDGRRPQINNAAITQTDGDGKTRLWRYCFRSGVHEATRPDGLSVREVWVMSTGPLKNKLRRREVTRPDGTKELSRNSYDSQGRLVRRTRTGQPMHRWVYNEDGSIVEHYRGEELHWISQYDEAGELVRRRIFNPEGVEDWFWERDGAKQKVSRHLNGELIHEHLRVNGKNVWIIWADGRRREWLPIDEHHSLMLYHRPGREEPLQSVVRDGRTIPDFDLSTISMNELMENYQNMLQ